MKKWISLVLAVVLVVLTMLSATAEKIGEIVEEGTYGLSAEAIEFLTQHNIDISIFEAEPTIVVASDEVRTGVDVSAANSYNSAILALDEESATEADDAQIEADVLSIPEDSAEFSYSFEEADAQYSWFAFSLETAETEASITFKSTCGSHSVDIDIIDAQAQTAAFTKTVTVTEGKSGKIILTGSDLDGYETGKEYYIKLYNCDAAEAAGVVIVGERKDEALVTRGEFVLRLYSLYEKNEADYSQAFSDVTEQSPYYDAVNFLAANGIIKGDGSGKFNGEAEITYNEAFTMAARVIASDSKVEAMGGYPKGALAVCAEKQLTNGISAITTHSVTEEHCQKLLDNIKNNLPGKTEATIYEGEDYYEGLTADGRNDMFDNMTEDEKAGYYENIISDENVFRGDENIPEEYLALLSQEAAIKSEFIGITSEDIEGDDEGDDAIYPNLSAEPLDLSAGPVELTMPENERSENGDYEFFQYETAPIVNHGGAILVEYDSDKDPYLQAEGLTLKINAYNGDVKSYSFKVGSVSCKYGERMVFKITGLREDRAYTFSFNYANYEEATLKVLRTDE